MTPQPSHTIELTELPLTSERAVLERLAAVVRSASRQQVWFVLLDAEHRQLPVLFPVDLPRRPTEESGPAFAQVIAHLSRLEEVAEFVLVYERPGPVAPTRHDLAWLAAFELAARRAPASVRGLYFATDAGVRRWDPRRDAVRGDLDLQEWPGGERGDA